MPPSFETRPSAAPQDEVSACDLFGCPLTGPARQTERTNRARSHAMLFDVFKAMVLGVVEGLTEFLPVSSTGHLLLLEHFFGFDDDAFGKTFVVLIQLGAILAILSIYFHRLWAIATGALSDPAPRRVILGVVIGFMAGGELTQF